MKLGRFVDRHFLWCGRSGPPGKITKDQNVQLNLLTPSLYMYLSLSIYVVMYFYAYIYITFKKTYTTVDRLSL